MKALPKYLVYNYFDKGGRVGNKSLLNHVLPSKSNHKVTLYGGDMTYKVGRTNGVHAWKPQGTNQRQLLTQLPSHKGSPEGCVT